MSVGHRAGLHRRLLRFRPAAGQGQYVPPPIHLAGSDDHTVHDIAASTRVSNGPTCHSDKKKKKGLDGCHRTFVVFYCRHRLTNCSRTAPRKGRKRACVCVLPLESHHKSLTWTRILQRFTGQRRRVQFRLRASLCGLCMWSPVRARVAFFLPPKTRSLGSQNALNQRSPNDSPWAGYGPRLHILAPPS